MSLPKKLPPSVAILLSLAALATVLTIDYVTQLSFALLYFLPIGIASWFLGKKYAFAISLLTALGWFLVFYRTHLYHGWVPAIWDTFIALAVLLISSHILFQLKAARDRLEISADLLETQVRERTSELDASNRELRETAERLKMTWMNTPIHLSMVDRNMRYHWLYNRLLPDPEKYVGKGAESFLPPNEAARFEAAEDSVMQSGLGTREEILLNAGGREVWFDMLMEPLRNDAGEIVGATVIGFDVTERKLSEKKLLNLNEALQRRTEQLRSLSFELTRAEERERHRIAHLLHDDLQQLLVAAKIALRTQSSKTSDVSSLDKVDALLDQSIAASRSLTAELVPPMLYEKGLSEALRWLAGWMQQKHGIEVVVDADGQQEELDQDILSVLFQSTRELLFNVVKHSQVKRAVVTLSYNAKDTVVVCIRDEGVGFDPAAQEISAGPLQGFGLVAMRERLAIMGGHLKMESAPGHGTTSIIVMPIRFKEKRLHKETPSESPTMKTRILIADDHPIVREGLVHLLRENPGTDVIGEAEDGQKAVELTMTLHPDVVLMDLNMPGMNGTEAARIIHRERPGVRVVGFSMHDQWDAGQAVLEAGAVAYLPKDCPVDDLLIAVQQAA